MSLILMTPIPSRRFLLRGGGDLYTGYDGNVQSFCFAYVTCCFADFLGLIVVFVVGRDC